MYNYVYVYIHIYIVYIYIYCTYMYVFINVCMHILVNVCILAGIQSFSPTACGVGKVTSPALKLSLVKRMSMHEGACQILLLRTPQVERLKFVDVPI